MVFSPTSFSRGHASILPTPSCLNFLSYTRELTEGTPLLMILTAGKLLYLYSAHMLYTGLQDMSYHWFLSWLKQFPGNIKNFMNAVKFKKLPRATQAELAQSWGPRVKWPQVSRRSSTYKGKHPHTRKRNGKIKGELRWRERKRFFLREVNIVVKGCN